MNTTKRLIIFLGLTFAATWAVDFFAIMPRCKDVAYSNNAAVQMLVALTMFIPALSVVVTRLVTGEGFKDHMLHLNLRGNGVHYAAAWFGMQILTIAGAAVFFLVFPSQWDPNHGAYLKIMSDAGVPALPDKLLRASIISQLVMGFTIAPLLNCVACFGEEWGWRGYMMPRLLEKMKFGWACLVGGLIWGIWHAPIIALGHNYGTEYWGAPWTGIVMMCVMCIAIGTIFTYWTVRTGSCVPAILGHGALNGFAAAPVLFLAENNSPLLGPSTQGLLGMSVMIVVAGIIIAILPARLILDE